jgi:micrococcal nuclease
MKITDFFYFGEGQRSANFNRGVVREQKAMRFLKVALCLICTWISFSNLSIGWEGKVVGVADGDTITVLHEGKGEKVRLYGIDCPEKRQDFGQKARQFTSNMVFGKIVEVNTFDTDQYGRTVGTVIIGSQCTNEELIKAGFAWVYTRYCKQPFCIKWQNLENEAHKNKVGLWSMPNPTPPWEFRHRKKLNQ